MQIEATHRADGRSLTRRERADATLLGALDQPDRLELTTTAGVLRCRGWVATRDGAPADITVALDGEVVHQGAARLPRPDVPPVLPARFSRSAAECGFDVYVPLPDSASPIRVTLSATGDEQAGTVELKVSRRPLDARADYKSVWNGVSEDEDGAKMAVAGYLDEETFALSAVETIGLLDATVGLRPEDVVLEIGAGVGRVGPAISPRVRRWIAADVSSNMLRHARQRCEGLDNVEFVELNGWDLAPISDESLDVVYCTVVFMHLDEWDRYGYVKEAMRVLRPGGRVAVDNFNLLSRPGWDFFAGTAEQYHPLERPANVSKSSTPEELEAYLTRAGFEGVLVSNNPDLPFLTAWGNKPER